MEEDDSICRVKQTKILNPIHGTSNYMGQLNCNFGSIMSSFTAAQWENCRREYSTFDGQWRDKLHI